MNTIDPISGRDIRNLAEQPSIADSKLTIHFESGGTRTGTITGYENTPVNHLHE